MNFLFDIFGRLLAFFYELVPSYGFAIIALTLVVMIIVTPLTLKGTRSMMMMQQLQPEMKKLQSKYKDDRQKLNEELLKFYKENNINPVGGCLPLLVQMPVFFVLYAVLSGLRLRVPVMGANVGWVVGEQASGVPVSKPPTILHNFDPQYLQQDSALYQALHKTTTMDFAGVDLAQSASEALSVGVVHAIPYLLLIVIVGITGFVQQRQIQGRTPTGQMTQQQQQTQQIMKIMPIFLPVISFGLPSGLVLYFAVSNLYRVGQQWFISRSIYGIKKGEGPETKPTKPRGGDEDGDGGRERTGRKRQEVDGADTSEKSQTARATAIKARSAKAGTSRGGGGSAGNKAAGAKVAKNGSKSNAKDGKATGGRSADRGANASRSTASKQRSNTSSRDTTRPPTLQPRARKNKKR